MAEREGFEPSVGVNLHTLSKRAPSTTRPPLRLMNKGAGKMEQGNPKHRFFVSLRMTIAGFFKLRPVIINSRQRSANLTPALRWRRGWDSNPRYPRVQLISSQPPSTSRPPLQIYGAPRRTRTSDLRFRKPSLYPTEPWALFQINFLSPVTLSLSTRVTLIFLPSVSRKANRR